MLRRVRFYKYLMIYTVYKTVNKINQKFYIGVHRTCDPNDKYLGSGKLLKQAIKHYGRDNFIKEVLFVFDNSDQAYQKEAEIVTLDFIRSDQTYNLTMGGVPTKEWSEERKLRYKQTHKPNLGKKLSASWREKIRQSSRGRVVSDSTRRLLSEQRKGKPSLVKGKPQSAESNIKRSLSHLQLAKVECPHCMKHISPQNAKRWHFEICKLKQ